MQTIHQLISNRLWWFHRIRPFIRDGTWKWREMDEWTITGWWMTYPSEKLWKSNGSITPNIYQYMEKSSKCSKPPTRELVKTRKLHGNFWFTKETWRSNPAHLAAESHQNRAFCLEPGMCGSYTYQFWWLLWALRSRYQSRPKVWVFTSFQMASKSQIWTSVVPFQTWLVKIVLHDLTKTY